MAIATYVDSAETAVSATNALLLLLTFLSTGFVKLHDLPGWAQPIAAANPISYVAQAMRGAASGGDYSGGCRHDRLGHWTDARVRPSRRPRLQSASIADSERKKPRNTFRSFRGFWSNFGRSGVNPRRQGVVGSAFFSGAVVFGVAVAVGVDSPASETRASFLVVVALAFLVVPVRSAAAFLVLGDVLGGLVLRLCASAPRPEPVVSSSVKHIERTTLW